MRHLVPTSLCLDILISVKVWAGDPMGTQEKLHRPFSLLKIKWISCFFLIISLLHPRDFFFLFFGGGAEGILRDGSWRALGCSEQGLCCFSGFSAFIGCVPLCQQPLKFGSVQGPQQNGEACASRRMRWVPNPPFPIL